MSEVGLGGNGIHGLATAATKEGALLVVFASVVK